MCTEHALAGRETVSFDEIADEPWIMRERGSGTRETLNQALRHRPGAMVPRLELEHTEAVKRAVESGLGLGCLSRLALRDAFRRGSLVALETPELDLRRSFSFVWHRGKYHSAAIRRFLEDCRAFWQAPSAVTKFTCRWYAERAAADAGGNFHLNCASDELAC